MPKFNEAVGFFEIKAKIERKGNAKAHWNRIGSATLLGNGNIICTLDTMPLNWDGTFMLFPSKHKEEGKEEEA